MKYYVVYRDHMPEAYSPHEDNAHHYARDARFKHPTANVVVREEEKAPDKFISPWGLTSQTPSV